LIEAKTGRPLTPESSGTYVCVLPDAKSKINLGHIAKALGVPLSDEDFEELHSTVMYSKGHFARDLSIKPDQKFVAFIKGIEFWDGHDGDGYLVVTLDSPDLQELNRDWAARGLVHSFPDYSPHVTLKSKLSDSVSLQQKMTRIIPKVKGFKLTFGQQTIEGLKPSKVEADLKPTVKEMSMATTQKFRSIEEIRKKIKEMMDQQRLDTQLVDKTEKALAKTAKASSLTAGQTFKILDISGDGKPTKRRKTLNVDFPVVKVPNMKELTHSYQLAERLSEQYKYVLSLENEVRLNFSNVKRHNAVEDTVGSIQKLKAALEKDLKRLFASLNEVAHGHAPKEYLKFVQALATEIEENRHIECDGGKTMTYAAMGTDEDGKPALVFAGYIILTNAVSDDGKIAPSLYIIIKWTVGGDVEIFVEHEFVAPSLLHGGTTVENLREATKAVSDQLSLEGFSSQIGNLPVSMQIRQPQSGLSPDLFTSAEFIDSVTAESDELIFTIKKNGIPKINDIAAALFMEVKAMLKKKRSTKVRMRPSGNKVVFTFTGLDSSGGIHPYDLDFLSDKYKLSDSQLRKIANIINGE
jgi:hypothetical protein